MTVLFAVGVIFILFCLFKLFIRQKKVTKIDGCTIRFFGMREEAVIEYTEPSGRTLTFDAYWQSQQKDKKVILAVEFPPAFFPSEGRPTTQARSIRTTGHF